MITEEEKKYFKSVLGGHYSKKIITVLESEKITDNSGKTHSSRMIVQVMNGETSHALIESAIVKAVEIALKNKKVIKTKKKKLIKTIA